MTLRTTVLLIVSLALLPLLLADTQPSAVLWQNMPLIALLNGDYTGSVTAAEVAGRGDLGLGAFANLDGEMVAVGGKIYQITSDGKVSRPAPNALLAFAQMIRFRPGRRVPLPPGTSFDNIAAVLSSAMPAVNSSYAIRITGSFSSVEARAPRKQAEPFPPFCEAQKTQALFHLHSIQGTMAGFIGPVYISALENAGFHLHFVTNDLASGGHVLAFKTRNATAELELIDRMAIDFPRSPSFAKVFLGHLITCP